MYHHHPVRPPAQLGFSDSRTSFSREWNSNCSRAINSFRNVRHMFSLRPCASESCDCRQHVGRYGYFSGGSCEPPPLQTIRRIPSGTRRFSIHGRPAS